MGRLWGGGGVDLGLWLPYYTRSKNCTQKVSSPQSQLFYDRRAADVQLLWGLQPELQKFNKTNEKHKKRTQKETKDVNMFAYQVYTCTR